jgi:hypothetical protein
MPANMKRVATICAIARHFYSVFTNGGGTELHNLQSLLHAGEYLPMRRYKMKTVLHLACSTAH